MFMTALIHYDGNAHEWKRNTSLLGGLGISPSGVELPCLYPDKNCAQKIDEALQGLAPGRPIVGIAPGSVWKTKRWLPERFAALAKNLAAAGAEVIFIGGREDAALVESIFAESGSSHVTSLAGKLTFLESAEAIRRCAVLVCNDSAPMHIAVAVRIPVVAIYGATIPGFGFAPYGERDLIIETNGLACRPCAIHGGDVCPIGTFECMEKIAVDRVFAPVARFAALI
jgi:heptosyltransferase-2